MMAKVPSQHDEYFITEQRRWPAAVVVNEVCMVFIIHIMHLPPWHDDRPKPFPCNIASIHESSAWHAKLVSRAACWPVVAAAPQRLYHHKTQEPQAFMLNGKY
jgi:hypothetical protein